MVLMTVINIYFYDGKIQGHKMLLIFCPQIIEEDVLSRDFSC